MPHSSLSLYFERSSLKIISGMIMIQNDACLPQVAHSVTVPMTLSSICSSSQRDDWLQDRCILQWNGGMKGFPASLHFEAAEEATMGWQPSREQLPRQGLGRPGVATPPFTSKGSPYGGWQQGVQGSEQANKAWCGSSHDSLRRRACTESVEAWPAWSGSNGFQSAEGHGLSELGIPHKQCSFPELWGNMLLPRCQAALCALILCQHRMAGVSTPVGDKPGWRHSST